MLSTSSFNALLKTLEEPPEHVKFVFATTDVQKVPTTILSRCQRFDLKRIPTALIAAHLQGIANNEKIQLTPEAAESVARGAEGGMRDAESMLDQLVAFCGETIDENDVLSVFGFTAQQTIVSLCGALITADAPGALAIVHTQAEEGRDLSRLMTELINHLRNLLVAQADPGGLAGELTEDAVAVLMEQASMVRMEKVLELIEQFAGAEQRMKWASNRKMHFEVAVIRAIQTLSQATLSEVLEVLTAMRTGEAPTVREVPPKPSGPAVQLTKQAAIPRAARAPVAIPVLKPRVAEQRVAAAPEPPQISEVAPWEDEPVAVVLPAAEETKSPDAPAPAPVELEPMLAMQAAEPIVSKTPVEADEPEASPFASSADDTWPRLLVEVRKRKPMIAMWVESGVLLGIDGGEASIGFPPEQTLAADYCRQAGNRKFLEELLRELTGQDLTLRCQMKEGLVVTPPPAPEPEPVIDPLAQFKNDPLIRRALEIFKAEIQPA